MARQRWADLDNLVMIPQSASNTSGIWTAGGALTVDTGLMVLDARRPGQLLDPDAWAQRRQ